MTLLQQRIAEQQLRDSQHASDRCFAKRISKSYRIVNERLTSNFVRNDGEEFRLESRGFLCCSFRCDKLRSFQRSSSERNRRSDRQTATPKSASHADTTTMRDVRDVARDDDDSSTPDVERTRILEERNELIAE